MADQDGNKTGGRVAGTPNKRTQELAELAKDVGADPFMFLVHVMNGNAEALGYPANFSRDEDTDRLVPTISFQLRFEAAVQLMPYLHAKRKAVEVSVKDERKTVNLAYSISGKKPDVEAN